MFNLLYVCKHFLAVWVLLTAFLYAQIPHRAGFHTQILLENPSLDWVFLKTVSSPHEYVPVYLHKCLYSWSLILCWSYIIEFRNVFRVCLNISLPYFSFGQSMLFIKFWYIATNVVVFLPYIIDTCSFIYLWYMEGLPFSFYIVNILKFIVLMNVI